MRIIHVHPYRDHEVRQRSKCPDMSYSTTFKSSSKIALSLPFPSGSAMLEFRYPTTMSAASLGHFTMAQMMRLMYEASSGKGSTPQQTSAGPPPPGGSWQCSDRAAYAPPPRSAATPRRRSPQIHGIVLLHLMSPPCIPPTNIPITPQWYWYPISHLDQCWPGPCHLRQAPGHHCDCFTG